MGGLRLLTPGDVTHFRHSRHKQIHRNAKKVRIRESFVFFLFSFSLFFFYFFFAFDFALTFFHRESDRGIASITLTLLKSHAKIVNVLFGLSISFLLSLSLSLLSISFVRTFSQPTTVSRRRPSPLLLSV